MSPILLRPIREQVEHDRVIRQLQGRWRRKYEVAINVGADETTPVKAGPQTVFPDLVLTATTSGRRLHGVVEVETAESVNHLEAKAEWLHFAKARGAFYLYVDIARFSNDSVAFARRMLDEIGVAATPGVDFDAERGSRYLRFSYAGPTTEMAEAAKRLRSWLA